jgi:predicted metal-dependent hydrolase
MGKHERIAARMTGGESESSWLPCYLEYFRLFNGQSYYEAHDVLEHIWLGAKGERYVFYKALIQFAGAYVHLQHHHREPAHRIHGRRLQPAARLFRRSVELLEAFPTAYEGISLDGIRQTAEHTIQQLTESKFTTNPWSPDRAPQLRGPV